MISKIISMLMGNPQVIEKLSETRLMRRSAQLVVGFYHSIRVSRILN